MCVCVCVVLVYLLLVYCLQYHTKAMVPRPFRFEFFLPIVKLDALRSSKGLGVHIAFPIPFFPRRKAPKPSLLHRLIINPTPSLNPKPLIDKPETQALNFNPAPNCKTPVLWRTVPLCGFPPSAKKVSMHCAQPARAECRPA